MILGRNTAQWTGLLTALSGMIVAALPLLFTSGTVGDIPIGNIASLVGIVTAFLGFFIAFLANDKLTPVEDPRLAIGTRVNVTDPHAPNGVVVAEEDAG